MQDLSGILANYLAGSSEAQYILAKASFLEGRFQDSQNFASLAAKLDQSNAKAHLLQSQIQFELGYTEKAMQALDTAFSFNFSIRSIPLYHFLKAKYLRNRKMHKEALESINEALNLPGVRVSEGLSREVSPTERLSIYLELADLQIVTLDLEGAEQTLNQSAKLAISGSTGELMVRLRMADLYIARGFRDLDKAIAVLNEVKFEPDRPDLFQKAQYKLADIYLLKKRDKKSYIQVYGDVASKMPLSVEATILLGDANMRIQNIEGAIQAYERLANREQSETLTRKIGEALVRGHYFEKVALLIFAAYK